MAERVNLNDDQLESVVGGALHWEYKKVWPKDNPNAVYTYENYSECLAYIKANWTGGAYNEDTLIMLEQAGLVTRAY